MSQPNSITADRLARLIGRPDSPIIVDVRTEESARRDPRLVPGSSLYRAEDIGAWSGGLAAQGRPAVVICQSGGKLSEGVAAWLRHAGIASETLAGGFEAWVAAGHPAVPTAAIPPRDEAGRTVWVTRARPKIDRIACPWLIRRFVDPAAVFLYVAPREVEAVAERFGATPFDIEGDGIVFSHRGEFCSFDVMVEEFALATAPLLRLARIVRGADTARLDLEPEAPGLLAASLGLSRMYADDLRQLEAGLALYDAFYRWCRDATGETHHWPNPGGASRLGGQP